MGLLTGEVKPEEGENLGQLTLVGSPEMSVSALTRDTGDPTE